MIELRPPDESFRVACEEWVAHPNFGGGDFETLGMSAPEITAYFENFPGVGAAVWYGGKVIGFAGIKDVSALHGTASFVARTMPTGNWGYHTLCASIQFLDRSFRVVNLWKFSVRRAKKLRRDDGFWRLEWVEEDARRGLDGCREPMYHYAITRPEFYENRITKRTLNHGGRKFRIRAV